MNYVCSPFEMASYYLPILMINMSLLYPFILGSSVLEPDLDLSLT